MARKAIVEKDTGLVRNVIILDEGAVWSCEGAGYVGCELMDAEDAGPGYAWDGDKFTAPEPELYNHTPLRLDAYREAFSADDVIEAFFESAVEGRNDKLDAITKLRDDIKERFPKA
jgi:hypothetical protein